MLRFERLKFLLVMASSSYAVWAVKKTLHRGVKSYSMDWISSDAVFRVDSIRSVL